MIIVARGKFSCLGYLKNEAWSDVSGNHDIIATKQDVLNEIIRNNQNLLINKQSIYNKRIKEAGFLKLEDILSNERL